ncbi:MAG: hypothetical protein AAB036_08410 [Elusimicrobiota bacterium]
MRYLLLVSLALGAASCAHASLVAGAQCVNNISDAQADEIGRRIWQQEGGGKILVWWDDTAQCSSFGINNYLWFPQGHDVPFQESFPQLIDFMVSKGTTVPGWIASKPPSPWKTRAELFAETLTLDRIRLNPPAAWGMTPKMFAAADSPRMKELKDFLERTISLQARFSAQRMIDSLPKMRAAASPQEGPAIEKQFYRVACSEGGLFNLVDYVNFKGEGTNPKERYQSPNGEMEGWGLLQILQHMKGDAPGPAALNEFADSAEWVISRRVDNAPAERREGDRNWLTRWLKRIQLYRGG